MKAKSSTDQAESLFVSGQRMNMMANYNIGDPVRRADGLDEPSDQNQVIMVNQNQHNEVNNQIVENANQVQAQVHERAIHEAAQYQEEHKGPAE